MVWSYNQGVVLGSLTELYYATNDKQYLTQANAIATSAINALKNNNSILTDPGCGSSPCSGDSTQFKGIFIRSLQKLQKASPSQTYVDFVATNAASIWVNARDAGSGKLGVKWEGPYAASDSGAQSSALAVLIADQAFGDQNAGVLKAREWIS